MRAKRFFVLAVLAIGSIAVPAASRDEVGIFFDQQGEINCIEAETYSTQNAYLMLIEPSTGDAIWGWECSLEIENLTLVGVILPADAIDVNPGETDFAVGLGSPLSAQPAVELARLSVLVTATDAAGFYIYPLSDNPSLPDSPAYAAGEGVLTILPMTPHTMGADGLVAGVNRPECIPENLTWGRVKTIYD